MVHSFLFAVATCLVVAPAFAQNCDLNTNGFTEVRAEVKGGKVVVRIGGLRKTVITRDSTIKLGQISINRNTSLPDEAARDGEPMHTFIVGNSPDTATFTFDSENCKFNKNDARIFACSIPYSGTEVPSAESYSGRHLTTRHISTQLNSLVTEIQTINTISGLAFVRLGPDSPMQQLVVPQFLQGVCSP